ncbi:hypothetical protein [Clostridium sp.]|uniref:hypothetical protein n=1 Tax=Clostridium sp. TaxID=1506 RepID=UPI003F2C6315
MKRWIHLILIIFLTSLFNGCTDTNINKSGSSFGIPENNSLMIKGSWEISDAIEIKSSIESSDKEIRQDYIGEKIEISSEGIIIGKENIYINPKYKLKVVNQDYVLSYELGIKVNDVIKDKTNIDIISIIDNNNLVAEFIVNNENSGYIIYNNIIIPVKRTSDIPDIQNYEFNNPKDIIEYSESEYNSDVGVMLALKTPRVELEDGSYTNEEYRTLWISFKDGALEPIIEKKDIIFPRMNGIWKISKENIESNGFIHEELVLSSVDTEPELKAYGELHENEYKNIRFVSNNYIAIEKYKGTDFKNKFPIYQLLPIDNVNSESGISFENIYGNEYMEKYRLDYNNTLNNLSDKDKIGLSTSIDYSNFSLERNEGRWSLVGKISSIDNKESGHDFTIGLKPNEVLLNYDTLMIPWKVAKGRIPFIEDIYTSPTGRIALAILNDSLVIYEIQNKQLAESPLANIELNDNEEVIMAEWCSGSYVDIWKKYFWKDGIEIMD